MKSSIARRLFLFAFVAFASNGGLASNANAFDSFYANPFGGGFHYGYSYRLPTPPYFSIYPPVYYGRRYERPYGDSPFASESHLGGNSSYHIRPKQSPVQWSSNIWTSGSREMPTSRSEVVMPLAFENNSAMPTGKKVTIVNPFVRNDTSVAGK